MVFGESTRQPSPIPGAAQTYRPAYHFSVPDNWKNDPQRPVFIDGEYLYYYLYNKDYLNGGQGTEWRLTTTVDHVEFFDHGVAMPKFTNNNGDCWSGSAVIDTHNTAGYGEGAMIILVTQAPEGKQAQFLWYSTDKGRTFCPGPEEPVLPNPGVDAFRDPKVIWDEERSRWLMVNAEGDRVGFYASDDLHVWSEVGEFLRDDIGLLECPDLFSMVGEDGSKRWVLGVSANGKSRGLPATYGYWVGEFDGAVFSEHRKDPRWLDWGFDFYGAVTYPHHRNDGSVDPSLRRALGWANFWDYPHNSPSLVTDGYNGDDMIVREVRLLGNGKGSYYLASQPPEELKNHVTQAHTLGDIAVTGHHDIELRARAYALTCTLSWDPSDPPENIGFELCRAPGGGRHVSVGAFFEKAYAYVNRAGTFGPGEGGESRSDFDPGAGSLRMQILVDHASVECFIGDGRDVHSHRVFPLAGDDTLRLFVHGGSATFKDLDISELSLNP